MWCNYIKKCKDQSECINCPHDNVLIEQETKTNDNRNGKVVQIQNSLNGNKVYLIEHNEYETNSYNRNEFECI
jgi:hypothetical protein